MFTESSFHLVGIGGIGMSGLARILRESGKTVTGSDRESSPVTDRLIQEGFAIQIGESVDPQWGVDPAEVVIHSTAVPPTQSELALAQIQQKPIISYPQALGEVTRGCRVVAVTGAHGKSTTTSLIVSGALAAGLDISCLVGTNLRELGGGNARLGQSPWWVIEACEYRRAFLNLQPEILVVTNIEAEHLDYYRDLEDYQSAFVELAAKLPKHGQLVASSAEPNLAPVIAAAPKFHDSVNLTPGELELQLPGEHNQKNARLALAVGELLGADPELFYSGVARFAGGWRRFELKGEYRGVPVIDDYAHHPTEIRATLAAARQRYPQRRLIVVYQQHQLDRAAKLLPQIGASFGLADLVLVPNIYAVRDEADRVQLTTDDFVAAIASSGTPARNTHSFSETVAWLADHLVGDEVLLVAGAGDVWRVTELLLKSIKNKA